MRFWKMNGAGNDFIVIDNFTENIPHERFPELARLLCERRLSIGADGLMAIDRAEGPGADFRMLYYNSDGSVGEMCGNGARCVCRFGYELGRAGETQRVETTAGIVTGRRISGNIYRVRLNDPSVVDLACRAEADGMLYECAYVELGFPGVPHAVLRYEGLEGADNDELRPLARALRFADAFPKGANVNFYDIDAGGVFLKTYERGVEDFTYACGTGTGSTALVLALKGLAGPEDIRIKMRGGELSVSIELSDEKAENIWLTGPADVACRGEALPEI